MFWSKPLVYYLVGSTSFATNALPVKSYPDPTIQFQHNWEISVNLPHSVMVDSPRYKRTVTKKTTSTPKTPSDISKELVIEYTRYPKNNPYYMPYIAGLAAAKASAQKIILPLQDNLRTVEKKLEDCQDPVFVRSLLDLFSTQHYPEWYGQQTEKKGELWDRTLLNVKDNVVNKIKCLLKNDKNLDEESFKKTFVQRQYRSSGVEVHRTLISSEAENVIKKCVKSTYNSETIHHIVNLMIEDVKGNNTGLQLLYKEYNLLDKEISVDEVKRLNLYKVLRITNVHPDFRDEMKLKQEFTQMNPDLAWYNDRANIAYILFPDFSKVFSAWQEAKIKAASYTKDGQASNAVIINQYTDIPDYETFCTLKVPCNVEEMYDAKFANGNIIPKCDRKKEVTFYEYKNIFDAVRVLQNNKNAKDFCPKTQTRTEIQLIKNPSA